MCVFAKGIVTNWLVHTNSCVPNHIIYGHYSYKKVNFLIAMVKKTHWYPTIETKIKEKTVSQKTFLTLMETRVDIMYIIDFKNFKN